MSYGEPDALQTAADLLRLYEEAWAMYLRKETALVARIEQKQRVMERTLRQVAVSCVNAGLFDLRPPYESTLLIRSLTLTDARRLTYPRTPLA